MDFEYLILDFIRNNLTSPFADGLMKGISFLGNAGAVWILTAVCLMLFKRTRRIGITTACALVLSLLICNLTLKPLIARMRPYELREGIELIISAPTDHSFPSGHSSASFAAAVAVFCGNRKWGAAALSLATLIAFSRLYLYVHFPTDVLCGALLGSLCGVLAYFIIKNKKPYKKAVTN